MYDSPMSDTQNPEIYIAHNGGGDTRLRDSYAPRTTSMSWHTDSSANPPPPGLVFLYMLECPDVGGDTISVKTAEAYKKLSRPGAARLQGLIAEHKVGTGVSSVLPVVRTHLVTGEKCLVVNPLCPSLLDQISFPVSHAENMVSLAADTTNIIGFKKEKRDTLLKFLFEHLAYSQQCQVRVQVDRPRTLPSSLM